VTARSGLLVGESAYAAQDTAATEDAAATAPDQSAADSAHQDRAAKRAEQHGIRATLISSPPQPMRRSAVITAAMNHPRARQHDSQRSAAAIESPGMPRTEHANIA